jgi:hypothetical protein
MASPDTPCGPSAKTSRHASAVAGSARFSPWLRAISTMEWSMTVVVIGSSTSMPGRPKNPPTAPVTATAAVWTPRCCIIGGRERLTVSATCRHRSSARFTALPIEACAPFGSMCSRRSIGTPSDWATFIARLCVSSF